MNASTPAEQAAQLILPFQWKLVGFALSRSYAAALLAFAAGTSMEQGAPLSMHIAMLLCSAAAATAVATSGATARASKRPDATPWILAMAGAFGVALIAAGFISQVGTLVLMGYAFSGICAGYYESVWGRRFIGMPTGRIQSYTLLMTALAAILGIALNSMSNVPFFISMALLPVGAALLFTNDDGTPTIPGTGSDDRAPGQKNTEERRRRALINILICCLVYSAIYNMVTTLAYDFTVPEAASQVRFAANLITATGLLALAFFLRPLSSVAVLRLVLPVTAVGFVLYLVAPSSLVWLPLTVSGVGRKLFDILTWALVAQAVTAYALQPDRYFGFLIAGKNMGYLLGLLLATVALPYDPSTIQAVTVIPILLLVLIVLFVWIFPERVIDQLFGVLEAPVAPEDKVLVKAENLARTCGCTPRETDVLVLLARGRTQNVIAQKLGVSQGTAHTHIVHVYQKLGVNSQQELIELVDQQMPR